MTGLDKIISEIGSDSSQRIKEISDEANKKAEEISLAAEKKASEMKAQSEERTAAEVASGFGFSQKLRRAEKEADGSRGQNRGHRGYARQGGRCLKGSPEKRVF